MNKDKIKGVIAIAGLFMLMMTAASVSADPDDEPGVIDRETTILYDDSSDNGYDITASGDEPNLISPNPDDGDLGPLILAPEDNLDNKDDSSEIFTSNFFIVVGLSGFAGLALGLVIFGRNK